MRLLKVYVILYIFSEKKFIKNGAITKSNKLIHIAPLVTHIKVRAISLIALINFIYACVRGYVLRKNRFNLLIFDVHKT